jgi:hypothetical protein
MLFISFSFNGAKITKLLHTHFKLYGLFFLILSFVLTDRINFTLLLYLKFSGVEEIFVFITILKCELLDPVSYSTVHKEAVPLSLQAVSVLTVVMTALSS